MAEAADAGENKMEEAKQALSEMVTEGVNKHRVHEYDTRARKPRIGNMGARQTWKECVGERLFGILLRTHRVYGDNVLSRKTRHAGVTALPLCAYYCCC